MDYVAAEVTLILLTKRSVTIQKEGSTSAFFQKSSEEFGEEDCINAFSHRINNPDAILDLRKYLDRGQACVVLMVPIRELERAKNLRKRLGNAYKGSYYSCSISEVLATQFSASQNQTVELIVNSLNEEIIYYTSDSSKQFTYADVSHASQKKNLLKLVLTRARRGFEYLDSITLKSFSEQNQSKVESWLTKVRKLPSSGSFIEKVKLDKYSLAEVNLTRKGIEEAMLNPVIANIDQPIKSLLNNRRVSSIHIYGTDICQNNYFTSRLQALTNARNKVPVNRLEDATELLLKKGKELGEIRWKQAREHQKKNLHMKMGELVAGRSIQESKTILEDQKAHWQDLQEVWRISENEIDSLIKECLNIREQEIGEYLQNLKQDIRLSIKEERELNLIEEEALKNGIDKKVFDDLVEEIRKESLHNTVNNKSKHLERITQKAYRLLSKNPHRKEASIASEIRSMESEASILEKLDEVVSKAFHIWHDKHDEFVEFLSSEMLDLEEEENQNWVLEQYGNVISEKYLLAKIEEHLGGGVEPEPGTAFLVSPNVLKLFGGIAVIVLVFFLVRMFPIGGPPLQSAVKKIPDEIECLEGLIAKEYSNHENLEDIKEEINLLTEIYSLKEKKGKLEEDAQAILDARHEVYKTLNQTYGLTLNTCDISLKE